MVKIKKYLEGLIPVIVSLAILVLFLIQPLAQAQQGVSPMTTSTSIGQVTPMLNTNVTWSTFYHGWDPLEYNNGTTNTTLAAELNPSAGNPISVNASDIQSSALNNKIGSTWWNDSANWWTSGGIGGQINTVASTTVNGKPAIQIEMNSTAVAGSQLFAALPLTWTELPSQNLAYDYATIQGYAYGTSIQLHNRLILFNQTSYGNDPYWNTIEITNETPHAGQSSYSIGSGQSFSASFPLNMPNVSMQTTPGISLGIIANTPQETSTPLNIIITGIAISEYQFSLGQTNLGNAHPATAYIGTAELATLNPSYNWSKISNNGYTVATSQPMGIASNYTETQASISSGSYIEETTQQAIFSLPTAPDLSYTNSNLTLQMNGINASQVTLINANGVSYSSGLSGFNGSTYALTTVNPNSPNSVIIQVEYTAAQWNSFTFAPSFFSVAGIEYYWWIFIISTLGAVGLFAGLKNYANGKANNFREVPPPRTR